MCTAVCYRSQNSYFGRNLDLERGYGEKVVITPRNYEIKMRCEEPIRSHYAMIGMAAVVEGFPLYYEATNERGVSMAGLNFSENASYYRFSRGSDNVTPFEFIPWILAHCACVDDARELLQRVNLVSIDFSERLPLSPLHWMISDKERSIVAEPLREGLKIHDDPFEVLTNDPPFPFHRRNVSRYRGLAGSCASAQFKDGVPAESCASGADAPGLPGDFSSASRFIRAFLVKENSVLGQDERSNVMQFFHILNSVAVPKGCVRAADGFAYTRYSSCCNADKGIYYYTTYDHLAPTAIDMHGVDLNRSRLYTSDVKGL